MTKDKNRQTVFKNSSSNSFFTADLESMFKFWLKSYSNRKSLHIDQVNIGIEGRILSMQENKTKRMMMHPVCD
jgi:hypothetical protein